MNKKGFVTSALLYGILSMFLILLMGTFSVIGNRKITNDKIKQSALDDVQDLTTPITCFELVTINNKDSYQIKSYNMNNAECTATVYIPKEFNGVPIESIGENAFSGKKIKSVTIGSNITYISYTAFTSNDNVLFILKGNMPTTDFGHENTKTGKLWGATNSSIRQD